MREMTIDVERYVLGYILKHPNVINKIEDIVTPACFGDPCNSGIYRAILDMYNSCCCIDWLEIAKRLGNNEQFVKRGGPDYLTDLAMMVPDNADGIELWRRVDLLNLDEGCGELNYNNKDGEVRASITTILWIKKQLDTHKYCGVGGHRGVGADEIMYTLLRYLKCCDTLEQAIQQADQFLYDVKKVMNSEWRIENDRKGISEVRS